MSSGPPIPVDVEDADIARAVDEWLAHGQCGASVVHLLRRPWEYATSAPLELVTAVTDDGREHDLVLKHVGPRHHTEQVRRVKPSFVVDSRREIEVYRRLLTPLRHWTHSGRVEDCAGDRHLLAAAGARPRSTPVRSGVASGVGCHRALAGCVSLASGSGRPRRCMAGRRAHRVSARLVPYVDRQGAAVLRRRWSIVVPS